MKVVKAEGLTWNDLENKAEDRNDWKTFICGLCFRGWPLIKALTLIEIQCLWSWRQIFSFIGGCFPPTLFTRYPFLQLSGLESTIGRS